MERGVIRNRLGKSIHRQVLDKAFDMAQAIVVLMTPDEIAYLRSEYAHGEDDPDTNPAPQARPNVLFEPGMAMGRNPDRTVLVELGTLRPFSDVAGRHALRLNESAAKRNELAQRLKTAGCDVQQGGSDWLNACDFTPPKAPGGPLGRPVPSRSAETKNRADARYLSRTSGSDHIQLMNVGSEALLDLNSPNRGEFRGRIDGFPIGRLPAHKSVNLSATQSWGARNTFDLIVTGRTEGGEEITESLFLDLNG
jgi:hypothetical protein